MLGDLDSLIADKNLQDPLRALPDARKLLIAFLGSCDAPKYEDYIAAIGAVTDWYLKQRDAKNALMPRRVEIRRYSVVTKAIQDLTLLLLRYLDFRLIFGLYTNRNRLGFELPRSVGQFILDHEKDNVYKNTGFGSQFEYFDSRAGVAIQRLLDSEVPFVKDLDDLQTLMSVSNRLVAGGYRSQFAEPPADISWEEGAAIMRLRTLERVALKSLRQSDSEFDPIYEHWTGRLKDWRQTEGDVSQVEPDSGEQMVFVPARAHFWERVLPGIGTPDTALSDIEHIHVDSYILTFANGVSLSCALETSEQSVPEIFNTNRFVANHQDRTEPVSEIPRDRFIGHGHRAIGIGLRHIPVKIGYQIVIYFGIGDRGILEETWRFLWNDW